MKTDEVLDADNRLTVGVFRLWFEQGDLWIKSADDEGLCCFTRVSISALTALLGRHGLRIAPAPRAKGQYTLVHSAMLAQLREDRRSDSDRAILAACRAVPDITISKWSCSPGKHWELVSQAIKDARAKQGINVDVDLDQYDHDTGNLRVRRQHAPAPDYRSAEEACERSR